MFSEAEQALQALDPILGAAIERNGPIIYPMREDHFSSLCRSIIGQQVSVASAMAVYGRLNEATHMVPITIAALDDDALRAIGLSRQKSGYIRDLAHHFVADPKRYNHLADASDEAVIAELTAVKGIGTWTAHMFLMLTLQRPDVFAPADVGLQRAIVKLYDLPAVPPLDELARFAERWQPYRTVASWHLWRSLDAPLD